MTRNPVYGDVAKNMSEIKSLSTLSDDWDINVWIYKNKDYNGTRNYRIKSNASRQS